MKKWLVCLFGIFCSVFCFASGKKDNVIINATLDNIEKVSNKEKFAFYYSEDNSNALQIALRGGNLALAEWLAENEICDLNHQNIYGRTPLNDAIESSDLDILKVLIEHGAKIRRTPYLQDPVVQTVVLGNGEAAEYFAELGVRYDFVTAGEKNMLHYAAQSSQAEIIPFLIKNGCKIDALDSEKFTPLLISVGNDDSDMTRSLLENGAALERKNENGQTPIFYAIEKFSNSALQTLIDYKANLEAKDSRGRTPFLFSYELDNIDASTRLLKAGSSFPRQQMLNALKDQKQSYLQLLLEAGADIRVTDTAGQTVLHIAASKSDGSSLALFLESNQSEAVLNSKDNKGNTPLLLACGTGTGFTNGVKLLLEANASVLDTDSGGNLPVHISVESNRDANSKELCQIILEKDSSVLNRTNSAGQTPVMIALKNAKSETSSYLLGLKADITQKDSSGNMALHYACKNNMNDSAQKIVSLGGAINAVNNSNETPICISAKNENEALSDYFLSFSGINIDIRDSSGKSARDYLWNLYDLRISESTERRDDYTAQRQKAWDDAASVRKQIAEVDERTRKLESENSTLQSKINSAAQGVSTSSWRNSIMANNISIAANNISRSLFNSALSKYENLAQECTDKINEEFKTTQRYIDKKKTLNTIPRQ